MTALLVQDRPAASALSRAPSEWALASEIVGHGFFRMAPEQARETRRRPGPAPEGWALASPSLLRYADEQTVAATAAVFTAIAAMGAAPERFADWGVVVASRYLGRANLAAALRGFRAEGVWGTSPHLIPHFALHSPSGAISLALGLHGPNLGVGGGLHSAAEGALAALTWLASGTVPGAWLVLTGWSPERALDPTGAPLPDGECQALALALSASEPGPGRNVLRAVAGGGPAAPPALAPGPIDLVSLAKRLEPTPRREAERAAAPGPDLLPFPGALERGAAESACRAVATDVWGWMRIELLEGPDGPG